MEHSNTISIEHTHLPTEAAFSTRRLYSVDKTYTGVDPVIHLDVARIVVISSVYDEWVVVGFRCMSCILVMPLLALAVSPFLGVTGPWLMLASMVFGLANLFVGFIIVAITVLLNLWYPQ